MTIWNGVELDGRDVLHVCLGSLLGLAYVIGLLYSWAIAGGLL